MNKPYFTEYFLGYVCGMDISGTEALAQKNVSEMTKSELEYYYEFREKPTRIFKNRKLAEKFALKNGFQWTRGYIYYGITGKKYKYELLENQDCSKKMLTHT